MNWKAYCKRKRIKWVFETPEDVEYTAPRGSVFANESMRRIIYIDTTDADIIESLTLFEAS